MTVLRITVLLALALLGCRSRGPAAEPEHPPVTSAPAQVAERHTLPGREEALRTLARAGWIQLNQHEIEDLWLAAGAFDPEERARASRAERAAAAWWLQHDPPSADAVRFEDPRSVFEYVWSSLPPVAIVYPTEQYYYYRFQLRQRAVAGNLRLVDADQGILHLGYFDRGDQARAHHLALSAEHEVWIERLDEGRYRVRHAGREVEFVLARRALACAGPPALLKHETCITGVLDESGVPLKMVYDSVHRSFSFVVNGAIAPIDALVSIEGTHGRYVLDRRTDFVFYADTRARRTLLVGGRVAERLREQLLRRSLRSGAATPAAEGQARGRVSLPPDGPHRRPRELHAQGRSAGRHLPVSRLRVARRRRGRAVAAREAGRAPEPEVGGADLREQEGLPPNPRRARDRARRRPPRLRQPGLAGEPRPRQEPGLAASHERSRSSGWPANADASTQPGGVPSSGLGTDPAVRAP
jgi:hypothetical protein